MHMYSFIYTLQDFLLSLPFLSFCGCVCVFRRFVVSLRKDREKGRRWGARARVRVCACFTGAKEKIAHTKRKLSSSHLQNVREGAERGEVVHDVTDISREKFKSYSQQQKKNKQTTKKPFLVIYLDCDTKTSIYALSQATWIHYIQTCTQIKRKRKKNKQLFQLAKLQK